MPDFMPGLELCWLYHLEVVGPLLRASFPKLAYSAARIGSGSEVLGFDTELSADHGTWGPCLLLFLREEDAERQEEVRQALGRHLPHRFRGYPTGPEPQEDGTNLREHFVEVTTLPGFFRDYLDLDIGQEIAPADWLTLPQQKLRTIVAGAVYHDAAGLQAVRERFTYYPHDVWLYLMAAGWTRIGQEEHLMGRAGSVGDELGSSLIAARLVRDLMGLCFLMERQYAPYPKWFGTAFRRLACAPSLEPALWQVQRAATWQEREAALVVAYEQVAALQNALGVAEPRPAKAVRFFDRPFRVIHLGAGFAEALCSRIEETAVRQIAAQGLIGSIDQFSDSTDLLAHAGWRMKLRPLYE